MHPGEYRLAFSASDDSGMCYLHLMKMNIGFFSALAHHLNTHMKREGGAWKKLTYKGNMESSFSHYTFFLWF